MTFEALQHPIRWLFLFHALAGGIALAVFIVPLLSKKGASLHVKTGWVYTCSMILVGVSAFIITPWRVFGDPSRTTSSQGFAIFLFFISAFTLCALWYGITVLKFKTRKSASKAFIHLSPPIILIGLGLATQGVGLILHDTLLIAFPFLGHLTARSQLTYWMTSPESKMHWWYAHMSGMFTACIATITAFLVTAIPRMWPGPISESPVIWIAPGIILGTLLNRWTGSYRKKFGDK